MCGKLFGKLPVSKFELTKIVYGVDVLHPIHFHLVNPSPFLEGAICWFTSLFCTYN